MEPFKCPTIVTLAKSIWMRHFRWSASSFRSMIYIQWFTYPRHSKTGLFFNVQGAWKSLEGRLPPGDPLRVFHSINLFVCVASHINQRCLSVEGHTLQIPSFFPHYFFRIEIDNPLFVEHFPWQASACPYVSSPTCHCLLLVRLVH